MGRRWAGRCSIIALAIIAFGISSCFLPGKSRPLNPRILFTVGSRFLNDSRAIAIKGSIEFEGDRGVDEGTFQLILNGPDSLSFLVEGPFRVDLFRMVIIDEVVRTISRDDSDWREYMRDDILEIPEYGIKNISPRLLGIYLFPQYFFHDSQIHDGPQGGILEYMDSGFMLLPGDTQGSFVLRQDNSNIMGFYSRRRELSDGFYPSSVELRPGDKTWRISIRIEKIKTNPRIPRRFWEING